MKDMKETGVKSREKEHKHYEHKETGVQSREKERKHYEHKTK